MNQARKKTKSDLNLITIKYLLLFILIPTFCISQNRNSIWVFGDSAGIDFTVPTNPITITSGMDGRGSCASIADSIGNLLFYSWNLSNYDDSASFIYNFTHDTMSNGGRLIGGDMYNQIVIIPFNNINKYYVFHLGILTTYGLFYTKVDMNLNGGLGSVTEKNTLITNYRMGDCLTAVKHGNGRDWWVISKLSDTNGTQHNRFYKYLVTKDSVFSYSYQDFNDASDYDFQKIIWHPSNDKFMLINLGGYMAEYDFDRCSGLISLERTIFNEQTNNYNRLFWEGSYSSNGDIFYLSTNYWFNVDTALLLQLDLTATNIPGSIDTLDRFESYIGTGALRLAPNGKIYFSRACQCAASPNCYPYPDSVYNYINMNLSVINSPDSLGASCDYQPFSFYLGGKRTYYGLPNNPNYDLGPQVGSPCDSLTVGINEMIGSTHHGLMYPNPASNYLNYKCDLIESSKVDLIIYNALSEVLITQKVRNGINEIPILNLKDGIYYFLVKTKYDLLDKGKIIIHK